jgi:hypothetical protein
MKTQEKLDEFQLGSGMKNSDLFNYVPWLQQ